MTVTANQVLRPRGPQIERLTDNRAKIVIEPLERGYGHTLGNALRRILLSSLQGAAVQSVHIDGVLHEFSSIAGVREDVTDIVLNIKDIAIKMQGEGPKRMVVKKQGPGTVTAGDIVCAFHVDDYTRWRLLEGLDDIGLTLRQADAIDAYEAGRPSFRPATLPVRTVSVS